MATGRSIDHIVLAVDNLDKAAACYQALGFTLTPRAAHEDRMGTSNRLIQFRKKNFIEILEVDRPQTLHGHDFNADPPRFSFGAHNRSFTDKRNGISGLVFASEDARADLKAFRENNIQTYAPFDFERQARLPDGAEVTVAFSLAFATSPELPGLVFFACQNRSPEHFWKPAYQQHDNGACSIAAIYLAAVEPHAHGAFLGALFGGEVSAINGGIRVACGEHQEILVLEPGALEAIAPGTAAADNDTPRFAGIALESGGDETPLTPAGQGYGMFIEWRPARG